MKHRELLTNNVSSTETRCNELGTLLPGNPYTTVSMVCVCVCLSMSVLSFSCLMFFEVTTTLVLCKVSLCHVSKWQVLVRKEGRAFAADISGADAVRTWSPQHCLRLCHMLPLRLWCLWPVTAARCVTWTQYITMIVGWENVFLHGLKESHGVTIEKTLMTLWFQHGNT